MLQVLLPVHITEHCDGNDLDDVTNVEIEFVKNYMNWVKNAEIWKNKRRGKSYAPKKSF